MGLLRQHVPQVAGLRVEEAELDAALEGAHANLEVASELLSFEQQLAAKDVAIAGLSDDLKAVKGQYQAAVASVAAAVTGGEDADL